MHEAREREEGAPLHEVASHHRVAPSSERGARGERGAAPEREVVIRAGREHRVVPHEPPGAVPACVEEEDVGLCAPERLEHEDEVVGVRLQSVVQPGQVASVAGLATVEAAPVELVRRDVVVLDVLQEVLLELLAHPRVAEAVGSVSSASVPDEVVALRGEPVLVHHRFDAGGDDVQPERGVELLAGELPHKRKPVWPAWADAHDALRVGPPAVHQHAVQVHAAVREHRLSHVDLLARQLVAHARREVGHPLHRALDRPGADAVDVPQEPVVHAVARAVGRHPQHPAAARERAFFPGVVAQRESAALVEHVVACRVLEAREQLVPDVHRSAKRHVPGPPPEGHGLGVEALELRGLGPDAEPAALNLDPID